MSTRLRRDGGFTLVELLIAVTVLGVIVMAISTSFSLGLNTMDETSNRLAGSNDAQLLNTYLPRDVASATEVVASSTGAGITCTGASNPKLQLTDGAFRVVYGVRSIGEVHQLERHDCTGGTVQKTTVVARNVASTSAVVPARIPASGTLTGASITVTEKKAARESAAYVFTVSGSRRAS